MATRIPSYTLYTSDTYPVFKFTISKSDGSGPQDLNGVSVKCLIRLQGSSTNLFTGSGTNCTVTDAPLGKVEYLLPSAITDSGIYTAQIYMDFGGSKVQRSERFNLEVIDGIPAS